MPFSYGAAPPAAGLTTVGQLPVEAHDMLKRAFLPAVAAPRWPGTAMAPGPPPLSRATVSRADAGGATDAGWGAYFRSNPAQTLVQAAHTSSGDSAFSLSSGRVYPRTGSPPMVRPSSRLSYLIISYQLSCLTMHLDTCDAAQSCAAWLWWQLPAASRLSKHGVP